MLRTMGRGMNRAETIAPARPDCGQTSHGALRTTFIVGHPGETEAHFNELLSFVREGRFTHAGVFTYSPEPETPAARLADDVPPAGKEARRRELMLAQLDVSRRRLACRVGRTEMVMLDGFVDQGAEVPPGVVAFGRTRLEAPEVDGVVLLRGPTSEAVTGNQGQRPNRGIPRLRPHRGSVTPALGRDGSPNRPSSL